MDKTKVKLILNAYRSGGQDSDDPFFEEAFREVRHDPQLAEWFAGQLAFDQMVKRALSEVKSPDCLRDTILLNSRSTDSRDHGTKPFRGPWWRMGLLAAAASIALVATLSVRHHLGPESEPMSHLAFVNEIVDIWEKEGVSLGRMTSKIEESQDWLKARSYPHDFLVPLNLDKLTGVGCQTYIINGQKISLLCFLLEKDRLVHLFVIDESGIKDPPGEAPRILRGKSTISATWASDGHIYLLRGVNMNEETLRELI